MTSPSPSQFITCHRRVAPSSLRSLRNPVPQSRPSSLHLIQRTYTSSRQFSQSSRYEEKDKEHVTQKVKKGDHLNIQESNAKAGMDAKKTETGGHATEQTDSAGGKAKAKKEFPEAPDVAIGMQDERGGRGG